MSGHVLLICFLFLFFYAEYIPWAVSLTFSLRHPQRFLELWGSLYLLKTGRFFIVFKITQKVVSKQVYAYALSFGGIVLFFKGRNKVDRL
jgi:hypothetical protein